MNNYNKNFKGKKWSMTRHLTTKLVNKFKSDSRLYGRNVWKSFANPNGRYAPIKRKIILHNWKVRSAWEKAKFNKRERVIEMFAYLPGNSLKLQHVNNEHVVKEKVFLSKVVNPEDMEMGEERIFGNSELATNALDRFDFFGLDHTTFCELIDNINSISS